MPAPKELVRHLRRNMTDAERLLWRHLRLKQMGEFKFRRQHPVGRYILDFACLEAGVAIELDGGQHLEQEGYDAERDAWLVRHGFRVLRFWNHEVIQETENVKMSIWNVLHEGAPPSQPSPWEGAASSLDRKP